mgnify:CR=1 FL=1
MQRPLIYVALATLLAGPALAQTAGTTDDPAQPAQTDRTGTAPAGQMDKDKAQHDRTKKMEPLTTQRFVEKAAVSGLFEVQSSELAASRTEDREVNAFARQMIADHTKANERLKELAQSAGQTVPTELDEKHQKKLADLEKSRGRDFDRNYMEIQAKAHEKAVAMFREYSEKGDDVGLKGFAKDTLPTLEMHLEQAQRLHKSMR